MADAFQIGCPLAAQFHVLDNLPIHRWSRASTQTGGRLHAHCEEGVVRHGIHAYMKRLDKFDAIIEKKHSMPTDLLVAKYVVCFHHCRELGMPLPPLEILLRIIHQIDTPKNLYIVRNAIARLSDEMTSFTLDSF